MWCSYYHPTPHHRPVAQRELVIAARKLLEGEIPTPRPDTDPLCPICCAALAIHLQTAFDAWCEAAGIARDALLTNDRPDKGTDDNGEIPRKP